MLSRLAISTANVTWAWFLRVPPTSTGLGRMYTTSSHECHVTFGSGHVNRILLLPLSRVEIAHIRDSSLIGQLIRSCLRQGCVYADFVNKRR